MKTNFWRKRIADYNFEESTIWLQAVDAFEKKLAVENEEIENEEF